jgi:hypothetical protein
MNEHRKQILNMLSAGQITAEEAERLIDAIEKGPSSDSSAEKEARPRPKYLRVVAEMEVDGKVNIRVPMQLLRAGVKLTGLIPAHVRTHLSEQLRKQGLPFDLNQVKPENLEELIDQLNDLTVDVDQKDVKVRVFCE